MSHAQLLDLIKQAALIIGFGGAATPLVTAFINNQNWSPKVKQAIMIALAIIAGSLTYLAQNNWQVDNAYNLAAMIFGMITAAQAAYHGLWKKGIATAITRARTLVAAKVRGKQPANQDASGNADQKTRAL